MNVYRQRRPMRSENSPGTLIALVGADGAGKSTVAAHLLKWLNEDREARMCHLGKQSGNIARGLARWPLVGRRMGGRIARSTKKAGGEGGPGNAAAVLIYAFTLRRLSRFRRMLKAREQGITIVADRYPQLAFPSGLDGPGFAKVQQRGRLARALARAELRHFAWMTSHIPDLVIRLNVDLETAIARKPDHRPEALAGKIAGLPHLSFGGAPIVDIDAALPLDEVLAKVRGAVQALSNLHTAIADEPAWAAADVGMSAAAFG